MLTEPRLAFIPLPPHASRTDVRPAIPIHVAGVLDPSQMRLIRDTRSSEKRDHGSPG